MKCEEQSKNVLSGSIFQGENASAKCEVRSPDCSLGGNQTSLQVRMNYMHNFMVKCIPQNRPLQHNMKVRHIAMNFFTPNKPSYKASLLRNETNIKNTIWSWYYFSL